MAAARLCILFFFFLCAIFFIFISVSASSAKLKWYKGALHCHTTVSDGDSTPQEVADWHKNHGYDFIVITDHDRYTDVNALGLNHDKNFLVIPGEEVSAMFGKQEVHINGINTKYVIKPLKGKSVEEVLQKNVIAIRRAGGIAMVNHPFHQGRMTEGNLAALGGFFLLEIHNAMVSTGAEHEMLLDRLTEMGKHVYGTATDDSHYIKTVKKDHWGSPGNGWVMVRAESLIVDNILKSLENGDFYATSGVILSELQVNDKEYRLSVVPEKDTTYTISFRSGELAVRQLSVGTSDVYRYSGKEPYIRAKIVSSKGKLCFTQPHLIKLKSKYQPR
ncbi:MAG: PHP domain-containing protein [Candidatus Xenobiia bacterium LiM19]